MYAGYCELCMSCISYINIAGIDVVSLVVLKLREGLKGDAVVIICKGNNNNIKVTHNIPDSLCARG